MVLMIQRMDGILINGTLIEMSGRYAFQGKRREQRVYWLVSQHHSLNTYFVLVLAVGSGVLVKNGTDTHGGTTLLGETCIKLINMK